MENGRKHLLSPEVIGYRCIERVLDDMEGRVVVKGRPAQAARPPKPLEPKVKRSSDETAPLRRCVSQPPGREGKQGRLLPPLASWFRGSHKPLGGAQLEARALEGEVIQSGRAAGLERHGESSCKRQRLFHVLRKASKKEEQLDTHVDL